MIRRLQTQWMLLYLLHLRAEMQLFGFTETLLASLIHFKQEWFLRSNITNAYCTLVFANTASRLWIVNLPVRDAETTKRQYVAKDKELFTTIRIVLIPVPQSSYYLLNCLRTKTSYLGIFRHKSLVAPR